MVQNISVTSESLQATIRQLLPSQSGFSEDLQATNLITPIIDLTPTAEGSILPDYLQRAYAFGSNTAFSVVNAQTDIISTPGFWQLTGTATKQQSPLGGGVMNLVLSDNAGTAKVMWGINLESGSSVNPIVIPFDFVIYTNAGEAIRLESFNTNDRWYGSYRQLADPNGQLVVPSGFRQE